MVMNRVRSGAMGLKAFSTFSKKARRGIIMLSIILALTSIFLPLLLNTYFLPTIKLLKEYRVGELADETVYSPVSISYIDKTATEALYREAEKKILPQVSYSISNSILSRNRAMDFEDLFLSDNSDSSAFLEKYNIVDSNNVLGRVSSLDTTSARLVSRLINECIVNIMGIGLIGDEDVVRIVEDGFDSVELESAVDSQYSSMEKKAVSLSSLMTRSEIPHYVLSWLSEMYPTLKGADVDLISECVDFLAIENIAYDEVLTKLLKENARASIEPVLVQIHKGEELISIDKLVTERDLSTINEINSRASLSIDPIKIAGKLIYILSALFLFISVFFNSLQYKYRIPTYTIITMVILLIILITSYFLVAILLHSGISNIDAFLPFLILPIIVSAITNNKQLGFVSATFYALLQNLWPTSNIYTFFYIIVCSLCCLFFLKFDSERIMIILQCLICAAVISGITIIFSVLEDVSFYNAIFAILASIVNVILANILMVILLPILERIFNIPTGFRLHELSYADTPTLNRLNQVALGTYNHSKNVSDMAYNAAKAVGVNAELARVGALYHDIGKSEHPEYFIENQTGKNVHEDISPTLSAAVIKSHVKLGVEKAKEIGLPQEVIDIIGEHHGNDLIKYFYNEAVKDSKYGANISEEDFRYTGRIPSTPESAIVMLSDCVEAATRTIKNPNRQKYDKFISNIVLDKINHKQLNDSQLTITDLDIIKNSFIHQLMGRDHHRIEYDNDK